MRSPHWLPVLLVSSLCLFPSLKGTAQTVPENAYQELQWRMIGPFRGGRTRAATGVPGQPNVFYIGQVNGGVWKSDDSGRTWNPIFDSQPTQSIGDIAVAPSDPNIIYVGSGEGLHRPDLSVGNGIYKSSDAGKTWKHLALPNAQQIPALAIDPRDPNRLFAAVLGHPYGPSTDRGIYRSTDGGLNWQKVLYKNENIGGSDVKTDPSNPNIVYGALWEAREGPWENNNLFEGTGGGLFKSTDGGGTWRQISKGLPANSTHINLSIAPSQPSRIYATVSTTDPGDYGSGAGLGVFRSDDSGESWYRATTDGRPAYRIGGGDLPVLKVDPRNSDVVYSASIVTMRSEDGGKTWTAIRGAPGGDDYQNLWINPDNPDIILLVSDQGAIITQNRGKTWSSWYNQPTAQLYHVGVTNTFPYRVCSGQQESGSVCISSRGNDGEVTERDWHPVGVIEYGYAAPDPLNADIIYGAGRNQVTKYDFPTGQSQNITPIPLRSDKFRFNRTEPILFSPLDPHTLFYAANHIFKSTNAGESWEMISPDLTRESPGIPPSVGELKNPKVDKQRGVVYALSASSRDIGTLWAGTDDGLLWKTHDGGKSWTNVTAPDLEPWSKVTQIEASHFDGQSAYASVSRFRIDDLRPYIYRTHDDGKTWKLIVNGLPTDAAVDTVREDPVKKGLLFAGTENAVFVSFDDGDHWQSLQMNLPHTSMRDLWIHADDLIVATHGRSFWILDDIAPLRQLSASFKSTEAYLFSPRQAFRVRRSTYPDTPIPPDEPTARNPPDGAIIDYFLPAKSQVVKIDILDSQDKLVRSYSSQDQPEVGSDDLHKQHIPLYWIKPFQAPPTTPGMHRWVWDLHYPAPRATTHEYPISAVPGDTPRTPLGASALPGSYSVQITLGGRTYKVPIQVKMDPRVKISAVELEKLFAAESHLAESLSSSSEALLQARSLDAQLKQLSAAQRTASRDIITAFEKKLGDLLEGPSEADGASSATLSKANGDIATLYEMVSQADAQPTSSQTAAAGEADQNLNVVMKAWEELKTQDLPAINARLKAAGSVELKLDTALTAEDNRGDEE